MELLENDLDELRVADRKGRITLGSKYAGKRFALHEEVDAACCVLSSRKIWVMVE